MRAGLVRYKTPGEIEKIRDAGRIIAEIFRHLAGIPLDGMSTWELDTIIDTMINRKKARPAFKTVAGYSHSSCISINNEVVHGVPSKKKRLKDGDIVKVDIGVALNGFFGDACTTIMVGRVSGPAERLVMAARESLRKGIGAMVTGGRLGDIGGTIQEYAESLGYSVVRTFTGHGIGYELHEFPVVPHYGKRGKGMQLQEGLVLAIEPMINEGGNQVVTLEDGWTTVTADGSLSAQFEHTVALTSRGPLVLTD